MTDLIEKGHMTEVGPAGQPVHYLPHHGMVKQLHKTAPSFQCVIGQ